ncbi:MAG: hypothetical protein KDH09_06075, partial [Chrysiogenetes bacterium]|nr:hypothetical protein [Chrysiogenetes bacterium]
MSMRRAFLSFTICLCFAGSALANGGPVDWSKGVGRGGILPRHESEIRLEAEDLGIAILDFNHYEVNANYTLFSNIESREVKFGVPLSLKGDEERRALLDSLTITMNGSKLDCELVRDTTFEPNPTENMSDLDTETNVTHWCVTTLAFKSGETNVSLSYKSQLSYTDYIFTKSPIVEYHPRFLNYLLFPAGYWDGPVKRFSARVDPGPYGPNLTASSAPFGPANEDGIFVYEGRDVDLTAIREIEFQFDASLLLRQRDLAGWNRLAPDYARLPVSAKASSTLRPSKPSDYAAENLLDGNRHTAWCEGADGNGVGEWIELRIAPAAKIADYCHLQGFAIIPAYAKSPATWAE